MVTAEPLTASWLHDYQARVDPLLTPIQRLAAEAIWVWFGELWEEDQVNPSRLHDLKEDVLPFFELIEASEGQERDDAIVELVLRLQAIDMSVFFRR